LNTTLANVVNVSDAEAGFVIRRGNFYYLFYNRGSCCNGSSSTYYIQVARSANPNGPYVDRNGAALSTTAELLF
jgi:arabinan endo-1,5-alpha-L-arabinosidase